MSNDWQAEQRSASFVSEVWPLFVSDVFKEELDGSSSSLARLRAGPWEVVDSVAIFATVVATTVNFPSDGTPPI